MLRSTKDTRASTRALSARGIDTNANRKVLDHTLASQIPHPSRISRIYSPAPNTSQLAARMKARRTLRSLGEGGWKGSGEFRKDTSELCSEELHSGNPFKRYIA